MCDDIVVEYCDLCRNGTISFVLVRTYVVCPNIIYKEYPMLYKIFQYGYLSMMAVMTPSLICGAHATTLRMW